MVKFVLGAIIAAVIAVAGTKGLVGWEWLGEKAGEFIGSNSASTPVTDPKELLKVIAANTDSWTETRDRGESTRDAYDTRLAAAREKLDFVRHQQKSLAVAYREAESQGFPMQWMSRYYDRSEALEQLDRLFQEEEHLQLSCDAFRKAITEAQGNVNEAIQKLARNQLHAQMAEATAYFEAHRQTVGADDMPQPDFLKERNRAPVRTVDELQAEQLQASDTNQRLARLNELLQTPEIDSVTDGQPATATLPEQIKGVLTRGDISANSSER